MNYLDKQGDKTILDKNATHAKKSNIQYGQFILGSAKSCLISLMGRVNVEK